MTAFMDEVAETLEAAAKQLGCSFVVQIDKKLEEMTELAVGRLGARMHYSYRNSAILVSNFFRNFLEISDFFQNRGLAFF